MKTKLFPLILSGILIFLWTDCKKEKPAILPQVFSIPVTGITLTTATLNSLVNANNTQTTVTFEYGTTTDYGQTVGNVQGPVTGNETTFVSAIISSLLPGTTYHFRVKVVNSAGTVYSDDISFTTSGQNPAPSTLAATNISSTGATLNGTVNANDFSTTVIFEYGTTTDYGQTVTATHSPVTGDTITNVSVNLSGLIKDTTYHFRAKAINSLGVFYGDDLQFATFLCDQFPTVTTLPATNLIDSGTYTRVTLKGIVNANSSSTTVIFDYYYYGYGRGRKIKVQGNIAAAQNPVQGADPVNVSADLSGLTPGRVYYFKVKADNFCGTVYGEELSITPE